MCPVMCRRIGINQDADSLIDLNLLAPLTLDSKFSDLIDIIVLLR